MPIERNMLDELNHALGELPDLLDNEDIWDSLIVNRRKPYTYRIFTTLKNGLRICLHKFDPCHDHEAFFHPHPWPGAFTILEGSYRMELGLSKDKHDHYPVRVSTQIMNKGSSYEIINPLTWHSVAPLETTYTVMINGSAWDKDYAHVDVKTTKGKDLDKLSPEELKEHLAKFKELLS